MALLSARELSLHFGGPALLDNVTFNLDRGERVCLVGRNGEGKSTLLKVVSGDEKPDTGTMAFSSGCKVGVLPQVVPAEIPGTVRDVIEAAAPDAHMECDRLMSHLDLDGEMEFNAMSGGQKRRALLARAMISEPDLLLLDEPTNHLDIESIQWMEKLLQRFDGAVLFVTHDRAFLQSVATRILELDRGKLKSWDCDYRTFLRRREEHFAAEEKQNAVFDKKLAQEEVWIRQGIKARRTRNEGRVRALKAMRNERRQRRERGGAVKLQTQETVNSGRKVIEAENVTYRWGEEPLVDNFTSTILRGDKIGLIGPNGCGKTTLLQLLLKKLEPASGSVEHGTHLDLSVFDQHREMLDEEKSIVENVGEGSDFITFNGKRRHVISYLEEFLFPPERSRTPVKVLSGGERNRLMLAKLFTRPGNFLILDEPTNDLDVETLELLESLLVDFEGTLVLVSHDREFLNNVVTSTLVFEGDGQITEYPGGYDDWIQQRPPPPGEVKKVAPPKTAEPKKASKRLTNWEEQELEKLPGKMEALEAELQTLNAQVSTAEFYQKPEAEQKIVMDQTVKLAEELDALLERWAELEERS